ncbi:hypothetical protein ACQJBY_020745 [Aegilops geniculata]
MNPFRVPAPAGVLCSAIMLLTTVLATHATNTTTSTLLPSSSSSCGPVMCGGLRIEYPFWLGGTHPPECGYRAFQVTCDGNGTASLKNSILTYKILDISYEDSSFRVTNVELSYTICDFDLQVNISSDLGLAPFSISAANRELFFLYDCIELQVGRRPPSWAPLNCDTNSFAWLAGGYKPDDKWTPVPGNCSVSMAPVLVGHPWATGANYHRLMERGFRLQYTAGECTACMDTGGLCRINTTYDVFDCQCPGGVSDGPLICGDQFINPAEKGNQFNSFLSLFKLPRIPCILLVQTHV